MKVIETKLKGCFIIEPDVFDDNRGWFMETYSKQKLIDAGIHIEHEFVQDNQSFSKEMGTIRGVHFQTNPMAQTKLVRCTRGKLLDVAVDLRKNSQTYKQWISIELTADNKKQLYIPRGFGHGFLTLSENVEIQYKADNYYSPECDGGIAYNDPEINIDWGIENPILSEKDKKRLNLCETEVNFYE